MIIESRRSDKIYVALPKYTTRREVSEMLGMPNCEDRGLLSFVLSAGEYIGPIQKPVASEPWNVERFTKRAGIVREYQKRARRHTF